MLPKNGRKRTIKIQAILLLPKNSYRIISINAITGNKKIKTPSSANKPISGPPINKLITC